MFKKIEIYFAAKKRLYPQTVSWKKGRFRKLKWILNFIFLTIYFLAPFLRFDRGADTPNQAILFDLPHSRIYFFFIEIWPQEIFYLMGILILAAVMLFFVTSLFGRIWCGYACFQTVWTDIFIALEALFQGNRNQRIILDRKNNFEKFYKKFLTHFSWIIVSLLTGYAIVCYFNDAILLTKNLVHGVMSFTALGWMLGIAGMTYVMAGFAREHVCTFMCPYSRFQSAMFDQNTLTINYDAKRGETRGKWKQGESFANRGHCIDCKQCVVVCPTGIDIRNGLQMECIACGLCVDACDDVMDKVGLPRGLIRYDTLAHLETPIPEKKFKILRPRTFLYSAVVILACGLMFRSLVLKSDVETSVIPDRNPLFVLLSDGSVRNGYAIKIMNKTHQDKTFEIKILSPIDAHFRQSNEIKEGEEPEVFVDSQSVNNFKTYVIFSQDLVHKNQAGQGIIEFSITDRNSGKVYKVQSVYFLGK